MDQELKQRLIGAAVITALAAIFVPMLFDDPIDETGKSINELKIPELPTKAQDVEIMPLPEKVEDVAAIPAVDETTKVQAMAVDEGEAEVEAKLEAPKPQTRLGGKETTLPTRGVPAPAPISPRAAVAQAEEEPAEAEDLPVINKPLKQSAPAVQPLQAINPVPKVLKPVAKLPEAKPDAVTAIPAPAAQVTASKPAPIAEDNNRWYLQAGTFSQKANAVSLQENLKQQGFAALVKEVASDKGTVFKVRIGPIVDKAKAQAVKAKLAQINVNSFVSAEE